MLNALDTPRIAIVGGGWAGLATAVGLTQKNRRLRLYEAARCWGGRARTLELEGKQVDNGQHILLGAYSETLNLMRRVGVDPDQALMRKPLDLHSTSGLRLRRAPLPSPLHMVVALLGASGLSWSEKFAALHFAQHCRRIRYQLDQDETLLAFLQRMNQPERLCRELWEPLCVSALNTPIDHASAQVFLHVLRDSLGATPQASDLLLPRKTLGAVFPDAAAKHLAASGQALYLGRAVRQIAYIDGRFRIEDDEFDAVVLAVAPQHAADLLPQRPELDKLREQFGAFSYEPIYTCYLQYASGTLPAAMFGFNQGLVQWAFDRGTLDGHRGLIAAVISARGAHQDLDRVDLAARVDPERFRQAFGAGVEQLDTLVAQQTVTIAKLMEIAPAGTVDPTPSLYNLTMYLMAALLAIALVANALMKPVDAKHYMAAEAPVAGVR